MEVDKHSEESKDKATEWRGTKHLFSDVIEMDRSEIVVRPEMFQGRDTKYAEETVAKILGEGFDKSREPIVVWKAEDGKYVVISGHSRFEASRRLYEKGDASLAAMPVKIFQGDLNEAMDYALLESNRTITQEGLKSDLRAYKRAKERGYNREYLKGIFKPESRLRLLEDISFLNENGSFLTFLDSPSEKSFPYLQRNAQWVGNIREHYPELTNLHEEEMFRYLYGVDEESASAGKKKLTITKDQFFDLINKKVSRIDFDPKEALNLDERVSTSSLTDPAKEQLNELQQEIDKLVKERQQKDELIAQAIQQGKNELIEKFKERQSQINQLITKKLLEKQKIESEIGKIERTAFDLFSQEEAPAQPQNPAKVAQVNEEKETIEEVRMSSIDNLKKFAAFVQKHKSIDAYNDGGTLKGTFGRMGKKAFSELAEYLGLKEYKVDFNKGGIAVSGDLTLMGMFSPEKGIYISFNKDGLMGGDSVLYRSIKHMKDYSGGHNNYFKETEFSEPENIKAKVFHLLDLNKASSPVIDQRKSENDIEDYDQGGVANNAGHKANDLSAVPPFHQMAPQEFTDYILLYRNEHGIVHPVINEYNTFLKTRDVTELELDGLPDEQILRVADDVYLQLVREALMRGEKVHDLAFDYYEWLPGFRDYFKDATDTDTIEFGFDGTDFKSKENFQNLLDAFQIKGYKECKYKEHPESWPAYLWQGNNIQLITANNPLLKEGYASFIGIRGLKQEVIRAVQIIEHGTGSIGNEGLEYIGFDGYSCDEMDDGAGKNGGLRRMSKKDFKSLLSGGEWFKANPGKILGEEYDTTDKYNKPVTRVKGTMRNVIEGINIPGSYLPAERETILSTEEKPDLKEVLNDPVAAKNIEKVIEETKKIHAEQALSIMYKEPVKPREEFYSFDDILREYNNGITEEEIKAWVWYKRKTGGYNNESIILDPESPWSRYVVPMAVAKANLTKWLKTGVVCYSKGDFIPSVLYYAENIYERQSQLLRDKEDIIKEYGKEQFDRQWKGLEAVMPAKLSLTDTVIENRLFINPISDFVKEVRVARLVDGTAFVQYSAYTGNESNAGITLIEAFKNWLKTLPKDEFKKSDEYNITHYYLEGKTPPRHHAPEQKMRLQHAAKKEGDALFMKFMEEAITREDQLRIEHLWNSRFNGYIEPNYYKIPVAFTCSSTFKNKPLFIRPVQREALGFLSVQGSGCIAFDVGLGKTMTAILAIANALQSGMCKRPFIVVPNQTYRNWIAEIRGIVENGATQLSGILPQYKVNDLYNLSKEYFDSLVNEEGQIEMLPEYSITVMTYEGFNKLGFGNNTWDMVGNELFDILNQGVENRREQQSLYRKIEELMGKGVKGGMVNIEDLGLDYMVVDEAHSMKKSFTQVKGEMRNEGEAAGIRMRSRYQIQSGTPSMIALRGFMIAQYILRNNRMRNVILLTATPFTNSPLEIYSILALIGYQKMEQWGIKNIKTFFDVYIKTSLELVINAKLRPERKEVALGFNNLVALQQLIFKFIIYRTGEDINIQRPSKIVLPKVNYLGENGQLLPLPENEQIGTNLPMTATQKAFMKDIESYVLGEMELSDFCVNPKGLEEAEDSEGAEELDENDLDVEEKTAARVLRGLAFARQVCLSPYLYSCNPEGEPNYEKFIETSPKLSYVMKCIASVKQFCEENGLDMPGQVIYMNAGVDYFPLIKEYLVKKIGLKDDQVGIIRSGIATDKKEAFKDQFLAGKIKVIIGSASIKEGINLQTRATDMYDCWPDWNPTDIHQLAGRIWRFGNIYAYVRFTMPLMEDSINIFEFQKLQEKTSRINQIWHRAGKSNSLKLEEINPSEIKMGLVTDPYALARLLIKEEEERIRDDMANLGNQKGVLEEIRNARTTYQQYAPKLIDIVNRYRPSERGERTIETSMKIFREYLDDENTSYLQKEQGQQIYEQVRKNNNIMKRGLVQVLEPKGFGLDFDFAKVARKIDSEIEELGKTLEEKTGASAIEAKAQEIIQERVKNNYRIKTVQERVEEFKSLNPKVLTEMMVYDNSQEAKEKQKMQAERGKALETSVDNLEEMETILKAMEEMAEIVREMDEWQAAA